MTVTQAHFLHGTTCMYPFFGYYFSTCLVPEAATAASALPSEASHSEEENWATQQTNEMEGKPEPSHALTQHCLNGSISGIS